MFDGVMPGLECVYVPPFDVERWLPRVRGHFSRIAAGSRGRYLPEDVAAAVQSGLQTLWIALRGNSIEGIMLTEMIQYPRVRALRYVALVGRNWRDLVALLPVIESIGRQSGCTVFESLSPMKYRHMLPDYSTSHVLFEKESDR